MKLTVLSRGLLLRGFSVLFLCAGLFWLFNTLPLSNAATETWMDAHVRHQGVRGVLAYVGVVTLLTGVGVPRQLCSTLGGYVFGAWFGTLWATVGTALACCVCFGYARFLGQAWIQRRFGMRIQAFDAFLCQSPFTLTVMVRIVPLGSNFLTNFLAGVSSIPAPAFLGGSLLGFSVQNAIFAMLGSGLHTASAWHTGLSALLYVVSLGLGYVIYRRYKRARA